MLKITLLYAIQVILKAKEFFAQKSEEFDRVSNLANWPPEDVVVVMKENEIVSAFPLSYEDGLYIFDLTYCKPSLILDVSQELASEENIIIKVPATASACSNFVPLNTHVLNKPFSSTTSKNNKFMICGNPDLAVKVFSDKFLNIDPTQLIVISQHTPKEMVQICSSAYNRNGILWPTPAIGSLTNRSEHPGFDIFNSRNVLRSMVSKSTSQTIYFTAFCDNKLVGVLSASIVDNKCVVNYVETIITYRRHGIMTTLFSALNDEMNKQNIFSTVIIPETSAVSIAWDGLPLKVKEFVKTQILERR